MSKKKSGRKSRDTPKVRTSGVAVATKGVWDMIVPDGYTRFYDVPEVRMCVNAYADLVSSMTIHLMRNTEQGDVRIVNELSRKIDINPNRFMNRKAFIYNIVNVMLTSGDGNCVVYPKYGRGGLLEELLPLKPSAVMLTEHEDGYMIRYGKNELWPDEVLHFAMNPDPEQPWRGTGFRISLRDAVKCIKQANSTKNALMSSPAPSLVVKVDGLDDDFASAEGRRKLQEKFISDSENGKPWMVPAEMIEVTQIKPLTLADLAIKDNLEIDKRVIAGVLGVPAFMVGVGKYDPEEYSNFVNTKIMGMAQYIQQELTAKTLYSHDMYWRFNPRSLYNYKLSDLITAGKEMVDRMAMRRNEWRDWVGLPPDADMEELLALENFIPADRLGDQKKLNGGGKDDGKDEP